MRVTFLSTSVDILSMTETLNKIDDIIRLGVPTQHVVVNANKINLMYQDPQLRQIVNECPLINADGVSVVLGHRFLGLPEIERVTGIDLFLNLLGVAEKKGYKVYFLGATQQTLKLLLARINNELPNLKVAGHQHGYFSEKESNNIAKSICQSGADIVFVAFSSPQKEYWIKEYLEMMNASIVIGVGGSFDVYAGVVKRAPKTVQKLGLEWLYRFIQEPKRMFKRYFIGNTIFLFHLLKAKLSSMSEK
ncbi:WecB/TagA/CpsF family glycosyltransferase [uncultured Vagococcus sp.]|uniref:WecB/TagA/CpsF family glycosyltransferase n=1 Tax=uncultured Vagococcus sp. TaxID=189676 RepID=UPI0028D7D908|nr:WecB/TagA/CpsF family glycosyltransferase [uncultured Vagococcus sp.]